MNSKLTPDDYYYEAGINKGFAVAESYFRTMVREFYRDVKKGSLKLKSTSTTFSTHQCDCEFCWTNEPKKV